jgi:hypothetical protein
MRTIWKSYNFHTLRRANQPFNTLTYWINTYVSKAHNLSPRHVDFNPFEITFCSFVIKRSARYQFHSLKTTTKRFTRKKSCNFLRIFFQIYVIKFVLYCLRKTRFSHIIHSCDKRIQLSMITFDDVAVYMPYALVLVQCTRSLVINVIWNNFACPYVCTRTAFIRSYSDGFVFSRTHFIDVNLDTDIYLPFY